MIYSQMNCGKSLYALKLSDLWISSWFGPSNQNGIIFNWNKNLSLKCFFFSSKGLKRPGPAGWTSCLDYKKKNATWNINITREVDSLPPCSFPFFHHCMIKLVFYRHILNHMSGNNHTSPSPSHNSARSQNTDLICITSESVWLTLH